MSTTVIIVYNMDPDAIAAAFATVAASVQGAAIEVRTAGLPSTAIAVEEAALRRLLRAHGLTERECDLVGLDVQGFSRAEIAARCGISPATVKKYWVAIYARLGIQGRQALRAWLLAQSHSHDLITAAGYHLALLGG